VKRFIKKLLPDFILNYLKAARKKMRRNQWRRSVDKGDVPHLTQADLAKAFSGLGIKQGDDLFVHSAMSQIGMVEGAAPTVINALRDVIGDTGTLMFPAFTMARSAAETMRDTTPFNLDETSSTMGKISEVFRKLSGVKRSAHPTHSVAALGPRADFYTEKHHLVGTPCGPGSPFQILSRQSNGRILCLGSAFGKLTAVHVIEDEVEDFPVDVYLPDAFVKDVIFPDGSHLQVSTKVHDSRNADVRIDNYQPKEDEILAAMLKAGVVTEGMVGQAKCYLINAPGLNKELHRLSKEGITIYA